MKLVLGVLIFALGVVVGSVNSGLAAQQQRATDITRLMKKDLEGCEGKEVLVSVLSAGPGTSGYHYHPGESFTYILEGTQTREAKGEESTTSGPGGFIYDGPMQVHRTENTTPVKFSGRPRARQRKARVDSKRAVAPRENAAQQAVAGERRTALPFGPLLASLVGAP